MNTLLLLARTIAATVFPLILAALLTNGTPLRAQPLLDTTGRWISIDPGFHSGLETDAEGSPTLYFRDDLTGYLGTLHRYKTTDGGFTWHLRTDDEPLPNTMFGDGFGITPNALITYDTGATWAPLPFDTSDARFADYEPPSTATATSRRNIVASARYNARYLDAATGNIITVPLVRLVATTDGGGTWRKLDTVIANNPHTAPAPFFLHPAAPFADFPVPSDISDGVTSWNGLNRMADSTTLILGATVRSVSTSQRRYYIGTINIATVWNTAPALTVAVYSTNVMYSYLPTGSIGVFYRTGDGGASWVRSQIPDWLSLQEMWLLSPTHIVTPNGKSFDGGLTWERWASPWHAGPHGNALRFMPLDSANYIIAGQYSLVAHSFDAGHTWVRNHAQGQPVSIAAHGRRVLVGWEYRGVTPSSNAGLDWADIGTSDEQIPPELSTVWAMGFPDTSNINHIIGIASFGSYNGTRHMAMVVSDGGIGWVEGARLPWPDSLAIPMPGRESTLALQFVHNTTDDGSAWFFAGGIPPFVSTDQGATWSQPGSVPIQLLRMQDSRNGVGLSRELGGLVVTKDGGATWAQSYALDTSAKVLGIESLGNGRYRVLLPNTAIETGNGGGAWNTVYTSDIAERPYTGILERIDDNRLYVAEPERLHFSPDGGRTYQQYFTYMFGPQIFASGGSYLYLAALGNQFGRWRLGGEPISGVSDNRTISEPVSLLTGGAGNGEVTLQYSIVYPTFVNVALYDMLGHRVGGGVSAARAEGVHTELIDLAGLPSGAYLVRVQIGTGVRSLPLTIAR